MIFILICTNILLLEHQEEVNSFLMYYQDKIKNLSFVRNTITSIVGYLIRRHFFPNSYFKDQSFVSSVKEIIVRCLSLDQGKRPTFAEIFEIMKINNYDLFTEKKSKLTAKQKSMIKSIEARILKIEAFEYQYENNGSA